MLEIFKSDIDEITQGKDVGDKNFKFRNKALGRGITQTLANQSRCQQQS